MNVAEAIRTRKSVRVYLDQPVEKQKLQRVLEAARLAPSAGNRQEWRIIVVTERDRRRELADRATRHTFIGDAPIILACCAQEVDYVMPCGLQSFPIDLAIAIDHMTLAAVEEGLGRAFSAVAYLEGLGRADEGDESGRFDQSYSSRRS